MTRRGLSVLLGAVALWTLGRAVGVEELFIVAAAAVALVIVAIVAVRLSLATVAVRRTLGATRLAAGQETVVTLELRNDARLPAALLLVRDKVDPVLGQPARFVVPGLSPGQVVSASYRLEGHARGRYAVGPLHISVRDPFGLAQRVRRYTTTDNIVVYPRSHSLGDSIPAGSHSGTGSSRSRRMLATGDDFYTMREYVIGDDLRQIHWPSSAHRNTLMVRQQDEPWHAQAAVLCDTRRSGHRGSGPDSTLEVAISAAASVVTHLHAQHFETRLLTETDHRAPPATSAELALGRLAVVQASDHARLDPALRGLRSTDSQGLLVAIVSTPDGDGPIAAHPDANALLTGARGCSGRIAIVIDAGDARGSQRAQAFATLLTAGGWHAGTLRDGNNLPQLWPVLAGGGRRRVKVHT